MENVPVLRNVKTIYKHPFEFILCLLIVSLVSVTFAQVVSRYVLQTSLAWSEELARFLLLWLGSLTAAYAFKTKAHFALRFVVARFSERLQKATYTAVVVILTVFLGVFIYQAFQYTLSVRNQIAPGTQMSMSIPYSSALFGGILMLYHVIRNWWTELFRPSAAEPEQK